MARKPQSKSPLTDEERHARFVETARAVEASEDPKDFEGAFEQLVGKALPERRPKPT
jgi:hypothetical protein